MPHCKESYIRIRRPTAINWRLTAEAPIEGARSFAQNTDVSFAPRRAPWRETCNTLAPRVRELRESSLSRARVELFGQFWERVSKVRSFGWVMVLIRSLQWDLFDHNTAQMWAHSVDSVTNKIEAKQKHHQQCVTFVKFGKVIITFSGK